MDDIAAVLDKVRAEAVHIDGYMRQDLDALAGEVDGLLLEVLEYGLFAGGKRVRPLLVVLAARVCGNRDTEPYRLGCAFEYLHAATLFHDDIIDNSPTRRGQPSVFQQFGTTAAILAGDFLHTLAMARVGELCGRRGLAIFCQATQGMVDGEFMQLRHAEKHHLTEIDYYDVIMGKTGLLIAAACEIGGLYGGGSSRQMQALRQYGKELGRAFQIIDDLLDYVGDTSKTGKKLGTDLVEGKVTLPLIVALQRAKASDRQRLADILADEKERQCSFAEVCQLIAGYDGFGEARKRAEKAISTAIEALGMFHGAATAPERHMLVGLAQYVLHRQE